jgi:malectin (di-glucose binding ER protein)
MLGIFNNRRGVRPALYFVTQKSCTGDVPGEENLRSTANRLEAERAELEAVLASGILGRSNYVVRFLAFVCEKYFDGDVEEVKEYCIAVHALGRATDFDPQTDTIVRVTAHTLRKRLEEYYRNEGADHAIHISLPAGHYVPNFVHRNGQTANAANGNGKSAHADEMPQSVVTTDTPPEIANIPSQPATVTASKSSNIATITAVLAVVTCLGLAALYLWPRSGRDSYGSTQAAAAPLPLAASATIRAVVGDDRKPYTDQAGFLWSADDFCTGGDSFTVSRPLIQGTSDAQLFLGGRHGAFHCAFPLPAGSYEMHLLFAETSGLQENTRTVAYSINGGRPHSLDVVDDAGADDAATTKVFTGISPESDGTIHLDFTNPESFLNAVEIIPNSTAHPLPIRILSGRNSEFRDEQGNLWLPDRYYFGGRQSSQGNDISRLPDAGLYDGQRLGHFHYSIPVATGSQYTVKLHFIERWFGIQNQNVGGVGSRVFDVSCNGAVLLNNFDIMREAQGDPIVKTFAHIDPTPQGKIEIYFTPDVNYPSISAVEVIPE